MYFLHDIDLCAAIPTCGYKKSNTFRRPNLSYGTWGSSHRSVNVLLSRNLEAGIRHKGT